MKKLIILLLILQSGIAFGQDTTYLDEYRDKVSSINDAEMYEVVQRNATDTNVASVFRYYITGNLIKEEIHYSNYKEQKRSGISKEWYSNGKIHFECNYENGKLNGQTRSWWDDGIIKRNDNYKNDTLTDGKCYNHEGNEIPHFDFEVMPEFPGGQKGMIAYLSTEMVYPKKAKRMGIEGQVRIKFVVNKKGVVIDASVVKSVNDELDDEALRVVNNMPRWKPGVLDGDAVNVLFTLPITFRFD